MFSEIKPDGFTSSNRSTKESFKETHSSTYKSASKFRHTSIHETITKEQPNINSKYTFKEMGTVKKKNAEKHRRFTPEQCECMPVTSSILNVQPAVITNSLKYFFQNQESIKEQYAQWLQNYKVKIANLFQNIGKQFDNFILVQQNTLVGELQREYIQFLDKMVEIRGVASNIYKQKIEMNNQIKMEKVISHKAGSINKIGQEYYPGSRNAMNEDLIQDLKYQDQQRLIYAQMDKFYKSHEGRLHDLHCNVTEHLRYKENIAFKEERMMEMVDNFRKYTHQTINLYLMPRPESQMHSMPYMSYIEKLSRIEKRQEPLITNRQERDRKQDVGSGSSKRNKDTQYFNIFGKA